MSAAWRQPSIAATSFAWPSTIVQAAASRAKLESMFVRAQSWLQTCRTCFVGVQPPCRHAAVLLLRLGWHGSCRHAAQYMRISSPKLCLKNLYTSARAGNAQYQVHGPGACIQAGHATCCHVLPCCQGARVQCRTQPMCHRHTS